MAEVFDAERIIDLMTDGPAGETAIRSALQGLYAAVNSNDDGELELWLSLPMEEVGDAMRVIPLRSLATTWVDDTTRENGMAFVRALRRLSNDLSERVRRRQGDSPSMALRDLYVQRAVEREDWPTAIGLLLQGKKDLYASCGRAEYELLLEGRRTHKFFGARALWQAIWERDNDQRGAV